MTSDVKPLTVQLPVELAERLNQLAQLTERPVSELATEAIARFLAYVQAENAATEAALAELDAGGWVHSNASVMAWMDSWETPNELAPPEPDTYLPPRRS